MRALKSWETYTAPGKLNNLKEQQQQQKRKQVDDDDDDIGPAKFKLKPLKPSDTKSLNDSAFTSANQATVNLMKQQSNPTDASHSAAQSLSDLHEKQLEIKFKLKMKSSNNGTKTKDNKNNKKKHAKKTNVKRESARDEQEEEEEEQSMTNPAPQKRTKAVQTPFAQDNMDDEIEELEEHVLREDDHELFAMRTQQMARPTNDVIIATPPASEVLKMAKKYDENCSWFHLMQRAVASSVSRVDYPDVPVISRKVLVHMLRECNPSITWERQCANADYNPMPYEGRMRCIAHTMTEELLGPGKGFRLREMLMPETMVRINDAIEHGRNPMDHLTPINEMCYLCHLWTALRDCTEQRDRIKLREEEQKDLTQIYEPAASIEDDKVVIINRFMVVIDQLGEYDHTKMLSGDQVNLGIWGPFPLFNRQNYVYTDNYPHGQVSGLRGFLESDNLLFRPARVLSHRMSSSQRTFSIQSTHTRNVSQSTLSHH